MKKLITAVLVLAMVAALSVSAFAADFGTITVQNATVDETYSIYKILDATYNDDGAVAYTISSASQWFSDVKAVSNLAESTPSKVLFNLAEVNNAAGTGTGTYVVTQTSGTSDSDFSTWLNSLYSSLSGKTKAKDDITVTADATASWSQLDFGYYLITSTVARNGSHYVSVTTNRPDATIIDKNQTPSWKDPDETSGADAVAGGKYIIKADGSKVRIADYGTGDVVKQSIEMNNVTNWDGTEQIYSYTVTDTLPDGMTLDESSVAVKINGTAKTAGTDYTFTKTEDGFTVTIPWLNVTADKVTSQKYPNQSVIIVEYNVRMNENTVIGGSGNTNTANISWSIFDPDETDNYTTYDEDMLTESSTTVYTTGINITKVDGADTAKTLTGAKFSITDENGNAITVKVNGKFMQSTDTGSYMMKDGTFSTTVPVTDKNNGGYNADKYDDTTKTYTQTEKIVAADGTVVTGLVYEGYVNSNGIISFDGLSAGTYKITELVSPAGYNILTEPIVLVIEFDETTKTFAASVDDATATATNNVFNINVANQAGAVLPGTGGIGTTIFYVLGTTLALGAVLLLFVKARTRREEK